MDPNTRQKQAIESDRPNNVVVAGPGTGKSKVILLRACWIVENLHVEPHDIVLASFTNASVADLRTGIETKEDFAGARGSRISTFHSLALSCLLKVGEGERVYIPDDWEESMLVDRYLKLALGLARVTTARSRRRDYDSRWCQATEDPAEWLDQRERRDFQRAFWLIKEALNFTTRGELTYGWWLQLSSEPAASNEELGIDFRFILVDEYQDLNECEHAILEILARRGVGVFVVGDPNQSIYEGLRHAHPELCESFGERFSDGGVVVLDETYRCPEAVLAAAKALMSGQPGYEGIPTVSHRPAPGSVQLVNYRTAEQEAEGVAGAAAARIAKDPSLHILIVVPARQVGAMIRQQLDVLECPHVAGFRSSAVTEPGTQRIAKSLARLIGDNQDSLAAATLVVLSGTQSHRDQNLAGLVKLYELSGKTAAEVLQDDSLESPEPLRAAVYRARERLKELAALPTEEAISRLEAESGLEGLEKYLLPAERRRRLEALAAAEDSATEEAAEDADEHENAQTAEEPGIRLTTYHSSKGLEADIVFLCAVEPRFFEEDLRSAPTEKRRLLFVGLTRSLTDVIVSFVSRRGGTSSYITPGPATTRRGPSDFLGPIREALGIDPIRGDVFVENETT